MSLHYGTKLNVVTLVIILELHRTTLKWDLILNITPYYMMYHIRQTLCFCLEVYNLDSRDRNCFFTIPLSNQFFLADRDCVVNICSSKYWHNM